MNNELFYDFRTEEDDELRDDEGFNLFTNAFVVYPVITWQVRTYGFHF